MCTINHFYHFAKIPKFQHNYFKLPYQVSDMIRILSSWRCNLESCSFSRGDHAAHALQESLVDPPWIIHSLWSKVIESILFAYQLQKLIYFKNGLSQTLTSTVVRWAHCSNWPLANCLPVSLKPLWAICSHHSHVHPVQLPWWLPLEQGYGK